MHARNSFKIRYFWKGLSKTFKKDNFIFLSNPVSFNRHSYQIIKNKRALELVTNCSSGYKTSSQIFLYYVLYIIILIICLIIFFISLFFIIILSDQVWWYNIKWFFSYSKNYTCKFLQVNSWHKLFHFHLSFWFCKVGKITQIWISSEWKELCRWNKKTFFIVFEGLWFIKKIKIW